MASQSIVLRPPCVLPPAVAPRTLTPRPSAHQPSSHPHRRSLPAAAIADDQASSSGAYPPQGSVQLSAQTAPSTAQTYAPPADPEAQLKLCGQLLTFSTARSFISWRLRLYPDGARVQADDHDMLATLLQFHPGRDEKIGSGIKSFVTQETGMGSRCFWVERTDGSLVDFSYIKCLQTMDYMYKNNMVDSQGLPIGPPVDLRHIKVPMPRVPPYDSKTQQRWRKNSGRQSSRSQPPPQVPATDTGTLPSMHSADEDDWFASFAPQAATPAQDAAAPLAAQAPQAPQVSAQYKQIPQRSQPQQGDFWSGFDGSSWQDRSVAEQQQQPPDLAGQADWLDFSGSDSDSWGQYQQQPQQGKRQGQQQWPDVAMPAVVPGPRRRGWEPLDPSAPPAVKRAAAATWPECMYALVNAVRPQLRQFKRAQVELPYSAPTCAATGAPLTAANAVVRYAPPTTMKDVAVAWMRSQGMRDRRSLVVGYVEGYDGAVMLDEGQIQSWQDYHAEHARLELVAKEIRARPQQ